jgi:hypothetical protein
MNKKQEIIKTADLPQMAFIIGIGRSGTTLLTNMLNSNPEVLSTPENEFILFSQSSFSDKDFNDAEVINAFINMFGFEYNKVTSIWKPSAELRNDIFNLEEKTFANVCKLVYLNYPIGGKIRTKVKTIVDKNPVYSLYLNNISRIYPSARYIVLTRDFRDNALSRKKYAHRKTSVFELAVSWNYYYENLFKTIKKVNLEHKIVRYEDLVSDSENVLKEICDFLQVTYSAEMLNFQDLSRKIKKHVKESASEKVFSKISKMHSNLETEVNQNRVKAYEKELSAQETAILEYVCEDYGKKFGYLDQEKSITKEPFWNLRKQFNYLFLRSYYTCMNVYYSLPVSYRLRFLKKK